MEETLSFLQEKQKKLQFENIELLFNKEFS